MGDIPCISVAEQNNTPLFTGGYPPSRECHPVLRLKIDRLIAESLIRGPPFHVPVGMIDEPRHTTGEDAEGNKD